MRSRNWPVQDAKARFSELLQTCVREEPLEQLEAWAEQVATTYNVLAMDAACFRQWAKFMHGQSDSVYEDAMIAATARVHELTVVTRNARDFARFDVPVLNPFG